MLNIYNTVTDPERQAPTRQTKPNQHDTPTCQASCEPDGTGVGAWRGIWLQQVTEDGVGNEVERVSRNVPQHHGPGPPVQPLEALCLQDAADALDGASVESVAGNVDGAQGDVGAVWNAAGQLQVLCRWGIKHVR